MCFAFLQARHIPLRLTYEERKTLRLVRAVLRCSTYTTVIDGKAYSSGTKRTLQQMKAIRAVLTGILSAFDYEAGARVADHRSDLSDHAKLFQDVFEIARRYKIMPVYTNGDRPLFSIYSCVYVGGRAGACIALFCVHGT